jgi:hypothetical protein
MTVEKGIDPGRIGLSKSLMTHGSWEGECLVWQGTRHSGGYGLLARRYVHRLAYEEAYGPIPDGYYICHKCDNPPCFRPEHLFAGTNQENQLDARAKGRRADGEKHPGHKLTLAEVAAVRASSGNQRELAAALGVSQSLISRIRNRQRWALHG